MSLLAAIGEQTRRHGQSALGGPRRLVGQRHSIPAPVGGWNTRDGYANMKPKYAIVLDNYFPEAGAVRLRKGSAEHATGVGTGYVLSLIPHQSGTVEKLYAVGGGSLYDVTASGAVGAALLSSLNSDRWLYAAFGGRTIACSDNDSDDPIRIEADGTLAAAHGWSGIADVGKLRQPTPFKGRMFFRESDSANLWYGAIGAIQGLLTSFPLDRVHPEGGNLIAMGSITIDAGSGVDDLQCFFFDSGAVVVYQGTDISSPNANGWSLVGIWQIGRLVGDKALVKVGGDLVALTTDGVIPLRTILTQGRVSAGSERGSLSDAISTTFSQANLLYGDTAGWDSILHTPNNWLLFNVPAGVQYVMNTQTRAWCRFLGWDARCFGRFQDKLYYGGADGKVFQAGVGASDAGTAINGDVQGAYNYLRSAAEKRFTMLRALVEADADISFSLGTSTDFGAAEILDTTSTIVTDGAEWNDAAWNDGEWAGGRFTLQEWQGLNADGTALSVRLQSSTTGANIAYFAADVVGEVADGIL